MPGYVNSFFYTFCTYNIYSFKNNIFVKPKIDLGGTPDTFDKWRIHSAFSRGVDAQTVNDLRALVI